MNAREALAEMDEFLRWVASGPTDAELAKRVRKWEHAPQFHGAVELVLRAALELNPTSRRIQDALIAQFVVMGRPEDAERVEEGRPLAGIGVYSDQDMKNASELLRRSVLALKPPDDDTN